MKYKSTRADIDSEAILSFEDVLFSPGKKHFCYHYSRMIHY